VGSQNFWSENYLVIEPQGTKLMACYECNVWKAGYGQLCDNPRIRTGCYACMKVETIIFMGYYKNTPRRTYAQLYLYYSLLIVMWNVTLALACMVTSKIVFCSFLFILTSSCLLVITCVGARYFLIWGWAGGGERAGRGETCRHYLNVYDCLKAHVGHFHLNREYNLLKPQF